MTECGCGSSGSVSKYYLATKRRELIALAANGTYGAVTCWPSKELLQKYCVFQVIKARFIFCRRKVQGIRKWCVWFFLTRPSHLTSLPASRHRLFILCEDKAWKDAIQKVRGGEGESRGCRNHNRQ